MTKVDAVGQPYKASPLKAAERSGFRCSLATAEHCWLCDRVGLFDAGCELVLDANRNPVD